MVRPSDGGWRAFAVAVALAALPATGIAQKLVHDHTVGGVADEVSLDSSATTATFLLGPRALEQISVATGWRTRLHDYRFRGGTFNMSNILRDPRGRWIAAAVKETLQVIALPTGTPLRTLVGPGRDLLAIACDPTGSRIAAGGGILGIVLWDVASDRGARRIGEADSVVADALAWSPTGAWIAIGGFDRRRRVLLYDPDRPRAVRVLEGAPTYISRLAFSPDGRILVAGSGGDVVLAWDPATGKERWRTSVRDSAGGYVLSFSPDGRYLLTEGPRGELMLLDARTGRRRLSWQAHEDRIEGPAEFSPGRPFVVSAGRDGRLKVWNLTQALHALAASP